MTGWESRLFTVWIGLLSGLAGAVNMTSLWLFTTPATHMTGNLSQMSLALLNGDGPAVIRLFGTLGAYVVGGVLSGVLFSDKTFRLANRYGLLLMGFGCLLGLAAWSQWQSLWLYLLALGVGMQNGLFIYYRGLLVRTSHFSGYLTDMGFALGRYLRGYHEDGRKIVFYLASILCFLVGGALAYGWLGYHADSIVAVLALAYILTGAYYFIVRHRQSSK